jgi:hypothetical protein
MNRRNFLAAAAATTAGAAVLPLGAATNEERCFYEFIRFESVNNAQKGRLDQYWGKAAIPALNRLGIEPIGVFRPRYGADGRETFVLIPHKTFDSFLTAWDKIAEDKEYQQAGAGLIDTEMANPLYVRCETTLMRAFTRLPTLNIKPELKGKSDRLFEVRTYESHSTVKAKLKIEMFNEGGEIALFKETGLNPLMFGETLAGPKMPNLTYILAFENMDEQAKAWGIFGASEGWNKIKDLPRYQDTVSSITDNILTPTSYSQI